ncbi:MAG TPA: cytoplasmic protein, partial [Polyangiaceae bacterium]
MPTRREALKRLATTGAVLGGAAAATRFAFDRGGFGLDAPLGERVVRDFRISGGEGRSASAPAAAGSATQMAIAKSSTDPAVLTRRAVEALGGMRRFVSNGDVVAIKPNIGWDRMPVHAANTNP